MAKQTELRTPAAVLQICQCGHRRSEHPNGHCQRCSCKNFRLERQVNR